jgi:hypothetical protein
VRPRAAAARPARSEAALHPEHDGRAKFLIALAPGPVGRARPVAEGSWIEAPTEVGDGTVEGEPPGQAVLRVEAPARARVQVVVGAGRDAVGRIGRDGPAPLAPLTGSSKSRWAVPVTGTATIAVCRSKPIKVTLSRASPARSPASRKRPVSSVSTSTSVPSTATRALASVSPVAALKTRPSTVWAWAAPAPVASAARAEHRRRRRTNAGAERADLGARVWGWRTTGPRGARADYAP